MNRAYAHTIEDCAWDSSSPRTRLPRPRGRWMVLLCLVASWVALPEPARAAAIDWDACTCGRRPLFGRVQMVNAFPDLKIKIVEVLPDLRVVRVRGLASRCGEWEIVTTQPALKVQVVDAFEDLRVQFVEVMPGLVPPPVPWNLPNRPGWPAPDPEWDFVNVVSSTAAPKQRSRREEVFAFVDVWCIERRREEILKTIDEGECEG